MAGHGLAFGFITGACGQNVAVQLRIFSPKTVSLASRPLTKKPFKLFPAKTTIPLAVCRTSVYSPTHFVVCVRCPIHFCAPEIPLRRLGCGGRADACQPPALAGAIHHR